jgi:hypothetical protein
MLGIEPELCQESSLGQESVQESAQESVQEYAQESIQESAQESVQESAQESVQESELCSEQDSLCYKGDSCSKSCLCPESSQEQDPRSITIENEAGAKLVLKAYSTNENRIVVNTVDMSFYEFKGYLANIGMVDDYEMLEKKHWNDIKIISLLSAIVGAMSVMGVISWFILLTHGLTVVA